MLKRIILSFFVLLSVNQYVLAGSSPVAMLENTANQVINELDRHKATLNSNPHVVYSIVDKLVLPHVDVVVMSRSVVRRDVWKGASTAQKKRFIKAFTQVVVRTYAKALGKYHNQSVKFYPILGGYNGKRKVKVNSKIIRPDGPPVMMRYKVVSRNSGWKVYDITVEGVSLLQNFRSQFASYLNTKDFNTLINELEKRNH